VNKGKRKGRVPKDPDPRLTLYYLRTDRRTVVRRLLVPSALRTSSVSVLNSVPRYFIGFRTVTNLATGAVSFGTAASWLIASFSFLLVFREAAKTLLLLRLRGSLVYLGVGQSLTPSPAEELSATVGAVLVLVEGRE
jgi:hypothetical protein